MSTLKPPLRQCGSGGRRSDRPSVGVLMVRTLLIPASTRADIVVPRCGASSRSRRITVSSILRVIFIRKPCRGYSCMSICFKKISDAYTPFTAARVAHLQGIDRAVHLHQAVKQGFSLPPPESDQSNLSIMRDKKMMRCLI